MAELAGYGGTFEYDASIGSTPNTVLKGIKNWTISYTADAHEVTDFSNSGVRTYVAGLTGWTGTIAGYYDAASVTVYNSTVAPGNTIECRFETSTASHDMIGGALITGMSFGTDIDGAVTINLDLQGSGALVIR